MTRTELITELTSLPEQISIREAWLIARRWSLLAAEADLADAEAALLLAVDADGNPKINGKNEAQRAAQLRVETAGFREKVEKRRRDVDLARVHLESLANRFRAARACAALLSSDEGRAAA